MRKACIRILPSASECQLRSDHLSLRARQPEAVLAFVANKFSLTDYETNARNAILLDFYLWILMFCKERGFNEEKTSSAFTIVRLTHEFAMKGERTVQDAFAEYKRLIIKHSLSGVADAVVLFKPQDVAELTKFVTNSYMQHYRLYKYANSHQQVACLRHSYSVETGLKGHRQMEQITNYRQGVSSSGKWQRRKKVGRRQGKGMRQ